MNDTASVADSALAISDTRPKRSGGGCVGIFFQLFDWNRRFANKKIFSKRLLPPGRGKDSSNKFGCDEKLPKLKLIADNENKANGNGASSSVGKNGVQTPTLVARLMGLESMPSVKRDKLLKDKVVAAEEITPQEFRPQKLQKTDTTRTVTRFGAEALQLKNVLSRSRKQHYPRKLASPVKTTSHPARKSTSRLIGAATRILEPGLQGRKSKFAITYYAHSKQSSNELKSDYMKNGDLDSSRKHTSCKNCGNLVDISTSSNRDSVNPSQVSQNGNTRHVIDTVAIDHGRQPQSFGSPPYFNVNNSRRPVVDVGVSSQSKSNCLPFNKVTSATDAVSDTKDFVALNRINLSGRTRSRVPPKVEDTKFDNYPSSGQKRPLMHIRKQGESSTYNMPRMVSSISTGKRMGSEPSSRFAVGSNNNSDGMAFKFNSPTKNRCEVPTKIERRRSQNVSPCKTTSSKKFTLNHQSDAFPWTGDSLGALLEKKLHELASQVEYESQMNGSQPKTTPANKFQDLIYALNMERSLPQKHMEFSPRNNHLPFHRSRYDHKSSFCLKPKSEKAGELTAVRNSNHLSPGSVLEASFSNDSCCSSSLEDSSVRTQHAYSTSHSYDESQFQYSETVPFYSDVLLSEENTYELVAGLLSYISKVLYSIDVVNSRLKGNIHAHVKEVIFYSELVLGNQISHNSRPNKINYFFVCDLLLELDTLAEIMWTRFGNIFGSYNLNARYHLKRFVFDALIEYLDSKYVQNSKCGFRSWTNLHPFMGSGIFIHEFVKEVRGWIGYIDVISDDELVERDMSHSLGRWTDFEIEGYETGAKIAEDILQMLIHEIVGHLSTGPLM